MNADSSQPPKKEYKKPRLIVVGSIVELTQNVNVIGAGDSIFNVLSPS